MANATSTRSTRGDAEAILRAFGSGGAAVLLRSGKKVAAPAEDVSAVRTQIRPFDLFNDVNYCALDWHTILIAVIEGGDNTFKKPDAEAAISVLDVELVLDEQALELTQTPVARFLNLELIGTDVAYYSQWGKIFSPDELAVGQHSLRGRITDGAGAVVFENTITFTVDAPETGACR